MSQKITDWALLKRVLGIAKPFQGLFWLTIFLAIIVTPFSIGQPFVIQQMVDNNILGGDREGLFPMAALYIGLLVINVVLRHQFIYRTALLGQSVIKDMRIRVFRHITHLRSRFFDQTPIGTATTRTINDIEAINNVFAQGVITIFADFLTLLAVLGIMTYTSWRLTLITLMTLPFLIISSYIFKEKVKVAFQKVRNEISAMNAFLQERITGMKTVQLFNAQDQEAAKFRKINRQYTKANLDSVFYYAVFFPVVELISAVALALMIWLGAQGYIQDKVTFGALVAFPLYLNLMFRPIRFMADKFNTLQMGLVAAERVFKILDSNEHIPNKGKVVANKLKGQIDFEDVTFAYDGKNNVIHNISFQIKSGETLALVGSTGSGKSTIINLVNRFYDIEHGKILVDGIDIKDYELNSLRSRIAIVLQDVFLFEGTILDNIRFRDNKITEAQVIESAKTIGAHDFIMKLPEGYQYKVSERGGNLSVGQRQLISFVRALVFDPDILVLDEATSSIDTETEAIIQYAIEKLIEKRTSIIIAHRLSTIRHAHQILVMSNGSIIERGHHDSLLTNENGHYRELYDMQFNDIMV